MAYTLEQIEYLHNRGLMPDWAYYQQNGKSAQANFNEQTMKFIEDHRRRQEEEKQRKAKEAQQRKEEEKALEAEIEKQVEKAIEKALDELLKDFGK